VNWASWFPQIAAAWTGVGIAVLPVLFFVPAPYGRYERPGWGPTVRSPIGWILMETPSALAIGLTFWWGNRHTDPLALTFLGMWEAHYLYRALIFPFLRREASRRMPLSVAAMGAGFNVVNGGLNGLWLFTLSGHTGTSWFADPRFLLGGGLFALGFASHVHSDGVLLRLRGRGESGYRIPRGGLFHFVSCPNYLGEIIEWTGWALATWSWAGLAFAIWTIANLAPRAFSHHQWYRHQFADYPANRKALLPFLL
jgi:3-oxo-5-alpha-steroid 4-dehydrogenase 1